MTAYQAGDKVRVTDTKANWYTLGEVVTLVRWYDTGFWTCSNDSVLKQFLTESEFELVESGESK